MESKNGPLKILLIKLKESPITSIFLVTVKVVFVTIACFLQTILYLAVRPWNRRLYRKIECRITSMIAFPVIVFLLHWWANIKFELVADSSILTNYVGKEHLFVLPNHKYSIDWVLLFPLAKYFGMLGNIRYFTKKSVQYFPVMGWVWKLHENPVVERDWDKDKQALGRQLTDLVLNTDPGVVVFYPEGTRFTETKHQVSLKVARVKGFQELRHHLLPRTKGFVQCIKALKNPCLPQLPVAVYDALVAVRASENEKICQEPTFMNVLKGKGCHVKILLRRYSLQEIPEDEGECVKWLLDRYQEKDQLLDNFLRTGHFFDEKKDKENFRDFQSTVIPRNGHILVSFIVFSSMTFVCILWLFGISSSGMDPKNIIYFTLLLAIGYLGMNVLDNANGIEEASSYGL